MNVARFSNEEERRRFYGEDAPAHDSQEFEFGAEWRVQADPGAAYALRWSEGTREIFVVRRPHVPAPEADDGEPTPSWLQPVTHLELGREVLGWAESRAALEEALDGWEHQMAADDSLHWVRYRLTEAAAETERQRGPGTAGWFPPHG